MADASNPPPVVTLERAWRDLMLTLVTRNPAKARQAEIVRRVIRHQTGRR